MPSHLSLFADLRQVADRLPSHTAVNTADENVSYAELFARVDKVAGYLQAKHIGMLALLADNSLDWIIVDLACLASNIVCIPLPTFFSSRQLRHTLTQADVDAVVCDTSAPLPPLEHGSTGATVIVETALSLHTLPQNAAAVRDTPVGTAKITFTSGSTGTPKGVCLSEGNISAVCRSLRQATADLGLFNHLSVLPYTTLLENIGGIYLPLLRAGRIDIASMHSLGLTGSSQVATERFLSVLTQRRPASLIIVPQQLEIMLTGLRNGWRAPDSLQFVAVGGGKVPSNWINQARAQALPVYEGYGLSECGSVVALNTPACHRDGAAGHVLPHCKVNVEDGEIIVQSNNFLGYLGAADVQPTAPMLPAYPPSRGVATGDLGHVDAAGFLHITGRRKNVLVSSFGRNISPEWAETELLASGMFQQCVVVGDARPFCAALVYCHNPASSNTAVQTVIDNLNVTLPDYARIVRWQHLTVPFTVENGLLTANGRLRRDAIATRFQHTITQFYADKIQEEVNIEFLSNIGR